MFRKIVELLVMQSGENAHLLPLSAERFKTDKELKKHIPKPFLKSQCILYISCYATIVVFLVLCSPFHITFNLHLYWRRPPARRGESPSYLSASGHGKLYVDKYYITRGKLFEWNFVDENRSRTGSRWRNIAILILISKTFVICR